ncbi:MAG TPA: DNA primase DnaG, partial [Methanomassiliicoccaceae archaeon]|nr:DNA primase DnaG [Methanomassiliicoccaceae archaeon]
MNIDPSTTKYMIKARLQADGIVEKPDVVGAIFGQTEGLLGDELDLRDLQKSGRIGRIEVEVSSKQGKSDGEILIPSSLDQVETVILASALETIDRVGPCKAKINILSIEDVRISKRQKIIDRAKDLLTELIKQSKSSGVDLTESVRQSVQVEEIVHFGKDHLPAGPNVQDSDAIIVVEGRSDVLNLLKSGIKNAIAVEGTNIPRTISDLSKERVITAFVDGDRGGELILRELFQVAEVDFVARAPRGMEVEELTQKQIMKSLRNKIPGEQYMEMYGLSLEPKEKVEQEPERAERHYEKAEKPHREPREKREPRRHEREPREIKEREPVPAVAEAEPAAEPEPASTVEVMGLRFPNRIGLAAGLDKNGEAIDGLARMGFGFLEIGTITPRPQPGNPKPRMFRLPEVKGIINRMGFNNHGIDALIGNVQQAKYRGILGINIGKNADTPIERAADDYLICLDKAYPLASYITVNISSPNTKNLRQLQGESELDALLGQLKARQAQLADKHGRYVPITLKIAPDLDAAQILNIADALRRHRIDAVIATSTTLARDKVQ